MLGQMLKRVEAGLLWLVFGPETTGTVEAVRSDRSFPDIIHVLVRSVDSTLHHFIFDKTSIVLTSQGMKVSTVDYKPGDSFTIQTRGTGMILLPFSKIERNPFNL